MGALHAASASRFEDGGINGVTAAIYLQAASQFLNLKWKQDKEQFKNDFIKCLDDAVSEAGRMIREKYDESTEQSVEERPAQPPTTP